MNFLQLFIILFFSTFTGWFISWLTVKILFCPLKPVRIAGFNIQGLLPAKQGYLANKIGETLQDAFVSYKGLDEKLADPALLQKLKPEIEAHVDQFLKVKLKEVFPILAQFMGDKTLGQFKSAFLGEIDKLLPVLIKNYTNELKSGIRLDQVAAEKINALSIPVLQKLFYANTKRERNLFAMACASIGLLGGIIITLILSLINI